MQKEKQLTYERYQRSFAATPFTMFARQKTSTTVTTHSLHHFSPLYILAMTLMVLQITDRVQEANVEGVRSNCLKKSL